jgi:hypothetical protein
MQRNLRYKGSVLHKPYKQMRISPGMKRVSIWSCCKDLRSAPGDGDQNRCTMLPGFGAKRWKCEYRKAVRVVDVDREDETILELRALRTRPLSGGGLASHTWELHISNGRSSDAR